MNSPSGSRIYYGFTICFTNSVFFREFTIYLLSFSEPIFNSLFVSRTNFEFTIFFANPLFILRIYFGSIILSGIYYGLTICFMNLLFFRVITIYLMSLTINLISFSEFTMDSLSVSQIHYFFVNLPLIYFGSMIFSRNNYKFTICFEKCPFYVNLPLIHYICEFTLDPLFFREFIVDSLSFPRNYHQLLATYGNIHESNV